MWRRDYATYSFNAATSRQMSNLKCYYAENRRNVSFFCWLRATQHCGWLQQMAPNQWRKQRFDSGGQGLAEGSSLVNVGVQLASTPKRVKK